MGTLCPTQHRIAEKVVLSLVSDTLHAIADYAKTDRAAFIRTVQEAQVNQQDSDIKKKRRRLAAAQKRAGELERLMCKIYEDRVSEKINERNFSMLMQKYEQEQGELETRIETLTAQLASTKEQEDGVNKWIDLIKQFSISSELTAELLNTLIEKILVHEAVKDENGNRTQEIEIIYRFVGKID